MEFTGYELHVKTAHSVGDIFSALKSKGFNPDLKMYKDSVMLSVKHPGGRTLEYCVKLNHEHDGYKTYEFKAPGESEMNFLRDTLKSI